MCYATLRGETWVLKFRTNIKPKDRFMSPIEQIAQWIEDKPIWWKHTVRLALMHGELEQNHLDEIYRIARVCHLIDPPTTEYLTAQAPVDFSGFTHEHETIELIGVSDVKGVGILAENQALKFEGSNLFIVYGDNGAGKSSYSSILKNACLTRGSCPQILGNVFSDQNPKPEANIIVRIRGNDRTFRWSQTQIEESLKSIRVFDSSSANHYINNEDSLGFKPIGLNLLTELTKVISHIKAIVEEDTMPGNGLVTLTKLNSTSPTAVFVNSLSAKNDINQLEHHVVTPEDLQRIEQLRSEIPKDKMLTAETKKSALNQQKELLIPIFNLSTNILRYLGDKAFDRLKELQSDYTQKQKKADEFKAATLHNLPLDTVAGVSWQTMWNAAKKFIEQEPKSNNFPPSEGDTCPLCLQTISESSAEKLKSLSKFLADSAAMEANEALTLVNNAVTKISAQSLSLEDHKAALIELEKHLHGSEKRFQFLFQQLSLRKPQFINPQSLPESIETLDITILEELKQLIESLNTQYENIKSDADLSELIQKKESELQLLEDKKFVFENRLSIENNIQRYKVIAKMKSLQRECNTRQVSTLVSQIYNDDVVAPLVVAFSEELKQFGFIRFSVKTKTRNVAGNQQLKLAIEEGGEPLISKIASEGEQQCIAIAAFLAEMKADNRKSAVIFDDPVNSLSHQWRSRVAERLVLESLERQVVIFTHDIVFYKLLLEVAERKGISPNSCALERSRKNLAGIVTDNAPWEALTTRNRLNALNKELQAIKKVEQELTENDFRRASREFYGRLRESWERLIEEKLLNKVVNRFERSIQTQRLRRLTDITDKDIGTINSAMTKCSTYFTGHDSAPAVGDPFPTIDEMETDLQVINVYLNELEGKTRKRN